jgi:putative oxidoreductase
MLTNPTLNRLDVLYTWIIKIGGSLQSLLLFYMRLVWGHQFFIIGLAKWKDINKVIEAFNAINIPGPGFHAYLVTGLETICGFLILIGLASRLAAIPLAIIMFTALATAHAPNLSNFQFLSQPLLLVKEAPYPFLLMSLMVLAFGPGRISVDAWIKRWVENQPRY